MPHRYARAAFQGARGRRSALTRTQASPIQGRVGLATVKMPWRILRFDASPCPPTSRARGGLAHLAHHPVRNSARASPYRARGSSPIGCEHEPIVGSDHVVVGIVGGGLLDRLFRELVDIIGS